MRLLLVLLLAACPGKQPHTSTVQHPSGPLLYDRIGRMDAIRAVTKDLVDAMANDPRLAARFVNVNKALVVDEMSIQLCELLGGPCKYVGRSMHDAHAELNIGGEDWAAFVADLRGALERQHIGALEQRDLLGIVDKLRADIVAQ